MQLGRALVLLAPVAAGGNPCQEFWSCSDIQLTAAGEF